VFVSGGVVPLKGGGKPMKRERNKTKEDVNSGQSLSRERVTTRAKFKQGKTSIEKQSTQKHLGEVCQNVQEEGTREKLKPPRKDLN